MKIKSQSYTFKKRSPKFGGLKGKKNQKNNDYSKIICHIFDNEEQKNNSSYYMNNKNNNFNKTNSHARLFQGFTTKAEKTNINGLNRGKLNKNDKGNNSKFKKIINYPINNKMKFFLSNSEKNLKKDNSTSFNKSYFEINTHMNSNTNKNIKKKIVPSTSTNQNSSIFKKKKELIIINDKLIRF